MAERSADVDAEELVREVFARVVNGDIRVVDLYNDDAVIYSQDAIHRGREAITAFYQRNLGRAKPHVVKTVTQPPTVCAFLAVAVPDRPTQWVLDVFVIAGTGIASLTVFRPVHPDVVW